MNFESDVPILVVKGEDSILLQEKLHDIVKFLVGKGDRSLMVEELSYEDYLNESGGLESHRIADAAQTPPFLSERRIVICRNAGTFSTAQSVEALLSYLENPLKTTSLLLVWEKSPKQGSRTAAVPKKLQDAIVSSGGSILNADAGKGKDRSQWVQDQLENASIKFDREAKALVLKTIGDDVNRIVGLLPLLQAVFGEGKRVTKSDVEPYLGSEGSVQPWDLTDAIDRGDVAESMHVLHRLMSANGWHPLQILASLHSHFGKMMALDGAGVQTEREAFELLQMKGSTFPAKKALTLTNTYGSNRIKSAILLLAQADKDLRGSKYWSPELVTEVLVARLASRAPKRKSLH